MKQTHSVPLALLVAAIALIIGVVAIASFFSGKAVGLAKAPVKIVEVPGPTIYVDKPGPTEYVPGPVRTVVRTVKVPRHCPSVANALNGYEAVWRERR